jgi:hypothetical protein
VESNDTGSGDFLAFDRVLSQARHVAERTRERMNRLRSCFPQDLPEGDTARAEADSAAQPAAGR